jgi:glyoxylase-like metal-dependent hydrolase (beta-lactamase superfamily II)
MTADLEYPLGASQPLPGETLEVADGVRWVRMPLPFALDHVNLWLLRDDMDGRAGWTIVDCGIHLPDTLAAWEQVLATQLEGLPVLRVLATHLHPDHIGNASWLCDRASTAENACRLWVSAGEFFCAHHILQRSGPEGGERSAAFFAEHGLGDAQLQANVRKRGNYYGSLVPRLPASFVRLLGGERLRIGAREWVCIEGQGHSPEHISLHCPQLGVMISGDMILPRISTNVSVTDLEPEGDPLSLYLQSIARCRDLPADTLILPSHGRPFRGLHARIDVLTEHHDERLDLTLQACRQRPTSAADLLSVLFRRELDLHQTTFAIGEAVAHLHRLWAQGALRRERDTAGVWRFRAI